MNLSKFGCTGPLEEVAKRQTAGLILPSPDGSHRPRAEFSHVRKSPAGGFVPHAPNVIRVSSRGEGKAQKGREIRETGGGLRRHTLDMKSKEEREYLNDDMNGASSSSQYQYNRQLPRHSSTIVQLGPLPRVEVRRRIKLLEARQQQTNHQRSRSAFSHARSGSSSARSPSAQRSLERMQRATAPSPAPPSYARARRYIPPALPSGIIQSSDQMPQEKPQVPARHTRQMAEVVQNAAKSHQKIHEPLCAKFAPHTFSTQKQKLEGNGRKFNEKSQKKIIIPEEGKRKQLIMNEEREGKKLPSSTDSGEIQSYHSERTVEHRRYTSRKSSAATSSESCLTERSVVRVSPPAPIQRREVVRREVIKAPTTKHTVHRIEEKKRTEEVERRVVRRERRHKSRRVHRGYHSSGMASGGHDYHYGSWGGRGGGWGGGGGGYRSRSASRRSGYANGYSDGLGERHLPISYEGGGRRSGGFDSERHFTAQNGHARYGSVTDSLRRGDAKYMPNGELKINGTGTLKHHRVHKAHSTRDVYHHDEGADTGSRHSFYQRREPFVEFPPSLDRRSEWSVPPEPPSHRRHAIDEFRGGQLTKARSFADWGEEGRGRSVFGSRGYDEDMARLENEFRDARLMRIPSGNMYEKQHHHREIPGGYETYEREVKSHSDRKLDGGGGFGTPPELRSRDVSQVSVKHENGLPPK
uniref:Btz domain-containing protein n=1 Tax=Meloidogyne hapla TaxID=6305 RepID=A0A1I8AXS7_MELHA